MISVKEGQRVKDLSIANKGVGSICNLDGSAKHKFVWVKWDKDKSIGTRFLSALDAIK